VNLSQVQPASARQPLSELGVFVLLLRCIVKTRLAHRRVVRLGNALGHTAKRRVVLTCGGGICVAFEFSLDLVESWGPIETT
jgi:hypothetical protein